MCTLKTMGGGGEKDSTPRVELHTFKLNKCNFYQHLYHILKCEARFVYLKSVDKQQTPY